MRKIARELLETEQNYVDSLQTVVKVFIIILFFLLKIFIKIFLEKKKVYLEPLSNAVIKNQPIISGEDIRSLFSIIEPISKVNAEFLGHLRTIVGDWGGQGDTLADLIPSFSKNLKIYTKYINNYDKTLSIYGQLLKTKPGFVSLIEVSFKKLFFT